MEKDWFSYNYYLIYFDNFPITNEVPSDEKKFKLINELNYQPSKQPPAPAEETIFQNLFVLVFVDNYMFQIRAYKITEKWDSSKKLSFNIIKFESINNYINQYGLSETIRSVNGSSSTYDSSLSGGPLSLVSSLLTLGS